MIRDIETSSSLREIYNLKNKKGITLIALVVTIIVLLILSGVVINMLIGSDGVITKAQNAKITTELGQLQEQVDIAITNEKLDKKQNFNINDYRTLKDFNPEIESKYSEYIGINNGKIYIKSYANNSIKNAGMNSGMEIGKAAVQDENGVIKVADASNIKNYKIYGNTVEKNLPEEYQQVDYIKSTGTQYIDTGYIPKVNTRVELTLKFDGTFDNTKEQAFIGVRNGENIFSANYGASVDQGNTIFYWLDTLYESGATIHSTNITNEIRENRNKLIIQSGNVKYEDINIMAANRTQDNITSLAIFGYSRDGDITAFQSYDMYVYDLKIYESDTLKRKMIPCYRKSDNAVGLYDIVENKFYDNNGSGEFEKGVRVEKESTGFFNEENNKYKIPIKLSGKNLWSLPATYIADSANNIYTSTRHGPSASFSLGKLEHGTYTLSADITAYEDDDVVNSKMTIYALYSDSTTTTTATSITNDGKTRRLKATITTDTSKNIADIRGWLFDFSSYKYRNVKAENIMLEKNGETTEFEPYINEKINIYLNEPLRSNGNVADYIDFEKQKVIRRISDTGEILNTPIEEDVDLSEIKINEGMTYIITIDTDVSPSRVEIEY